MFLHKGIDHYYSSCNIALSPFFLTVSQTSTPREISSQVAHLTGVNAKAIRYYESIGFLPSPPRAANLYRRYSMADVNRLNLLRRIRLLGVPLSAAKSLLVGATDARCLDVQQELLALVNERLKAIDQEI